MGWGENQQRFLPTVVNALLSNTPARLGSGRQIRDVMDVRDAGAALAALAASDVCGAVNIGSGRGIALGEIARLAANSRSRPDMLQFGAVPARPGEPPQLMADVSRLRDEVGFTPRYALNETIESAFEYWMQQRSKPGAVAGGVV
jgi:nucleoside-diphosphate-sugar epimerase